MVCLPDHFSAFLVWVASLVIPEHSHLPVDVGWGVSPDVPPTCACTPYSPETVEPEPHACPLARIAYSHR